MDWHSARMSQVMTHPCKSVGPQVLAAEAVLLMESHRITALPVLDEQGYVVGALNIHDLMRSGVY
jgi:arabinose-5-phosphate isomerase